MGLKISPHGSKPLWIARINNFDYSIRLGKNGSVRNLANAMDAHTIAWCCSHAQVFALCIKNIPIQLKRVTYRYHQNGFIFVKQAWSTESNCKTKMWDDTHTCRVMAESEWEREIGKRRRRADKRESVFYRPKYIYWCYDEYEIVGVRFAIVWD